MFYILLFIIVLIFIFLPAQEQSAQPSSQPFNEYAIIEEQEDKRLDRELKARRYNIAQAKESRLCDHRGHRAGQRPRKTLRDKRVSLYIEAPLDIEALEKELIKGG